VKISISWKWSVMSANENIIWKAEIVKEKRQYRIKYQYENGISANNNVSMKIIMKTMANGKWKWKYQRKWEWKKIAENNQWESWKWKMKMQ